MISFAPLRHFCESRNTKSHQYINLKLKSIDNLISPFLVLLLFLLSCSNNQQETNSILSKPVMAEVLAEMELAQAAYKYQNISQRFDIHFMFEEIYKKNKVTKEEFNTSLKFYSSSPKEMDDIYNETIELLTKKQADAIGK